MTQDTCTVLAGIFPIVLLTVVVEGRLIHPNIRRRTWYSKVILVTFSSALMGLIVCVIGVQTEGLNWLGSVVAWMVAAVAGAGLVSLLIAILATDEAEVEKIA